MEDKPQSRLRAAALLATAMVIIVVVAIALTYASSPYILDPKILITLMTPVVALGATVVSYYYGSSSRKDHEVENRFLTEVQDQESQIAASIKDDDTDFKSLWAVTQKRIDVYHRIATNQARRSFVSSQIATVLGFVLIIMFGLIAAQAPTPTGAISAGAVGVVGGGLSAFIGATFMRAQSEASGQLRQFFVQPVEFSRLLGAERLIVETLPEAERSAAVQHILKAMMQPQLDVDTKAKKTS